MIKKLYISTTIMEQRNTPKNMTPDRNFKKAEEILRTLKLNPHHPQKEELLQTFNDINNTFDIPHSPYYFGVDINLKKINNEEK